MMLVFTKKHHADLVQLQAACHALFSKAAAMVRRPTFRLNYLAETVIITPHSATHYSMHPQATLNPNPLSQELVRSHTEAVELRDEASAERQQRQLLQEASASGVYVGGGVH